MNHLAALTKLTCTAATVLLLASACGGSSFSGGDDPQGGSGGSTSRAGAGSTAGKPPTTGGSTATGGNVGTGGRVSTAGSGGVAGGGPGGEACSAPPDSGQCDAYAERWYNDPSTGVCRPFVYGGCEGNDNNYQTLEACQKACPGGPPNYDECNEPTDCMIAGTGCCGVCDNPNLTAWDLIAYSKSYAGVFQQCALAAAPGAEAPQDPNFPACAPCPPLTGDTGSLKYFVPNCVQKQCVVEDIRTSAVSACKVDSDCYLRNGSACCESCGATQAVAVNTSNALEQLVCGDELIGCPDCAAAPIGATATCAANGHCVVSPYAAGGTD